MIFDRCNDKDNHVKTILTVWSIFEFTVTNVLKPIPKIIHYNFSLLCVQKGTTRIMKDRINSRYLKLASNEIPRFKFRISFSVEY